MSVKEIESLRLLVKDAAAKNLLPTAAFFCEKIICLPGKTDEDHYNLARLYFQQKQFKRALVTLQKASSNDSPNFRLLAGQCLAESKEYEQCLSVLGEEDDTASASDMMDQNDGIEVSAAMNLLRGKVYDAQQNRVKAAFWYKKSLQRDYRCYEAFEKLIESHMLSSQEQADLLNTLHFKDSEVWLQAMYKSRMEKYDLSVDKPLQLEDCGADVKQSACSIFDSSIDSMTIVAEFYYYHNDFRQCYNQTKKILQIDPFANCCLAYHLSSLVELKLAWYAVGCYYFLTKKFDQARRFFQKSTSMNNYFAPAWMGYGHTFSAQDESDPALAAYRTASRFFSGSHLPPLCIGMEYAKSGNLQVADQFFSHALSICSVDPLVYNEVGVLRYYQGCYDQAAKAFEKVLELCQDDESSVWEATFFNLGHCYRKMNSFDNALAMYHKSLRCSPRTASTYTAIGFTHHLKREFDTAITFYHKALGISADDALTTEMLERALREASYFGSVTPSF
ncbi:hypothetical protein GUITHDRAFT_161443 [Guillardia theta CCMP2712]|uniref:Anaphase-promoting complex subunit 6 n=1 Tax=Guillardia theta (strain CCMP2712) TaxID=905079 RepID=L1JTX5_GUITC|nr:hypothetical protein GUITHDRAFT_161443 [Guillardia theta CCMP2712]EKX51857.1 hypothetical protein GUITHDRAFT_161443 [Guillardia theta CCMP2712]|eukprot:XP_005838837.1 hypothetical protein GUITHDRAFT_161443 [Guillardia theta CCMP2712]